MTGTGKMKLSNGDMLLGTFVQGLLHGQGVIDYANGDRFSGSFENGVRCGKGEFRCPAASLEYVGEWADDDVHGEGVCVFVCGGWEQFSHLSLRETCGGQSFLHGHV